MTGYPQQHFYPQQQQYPPPPQPPLLPYQQEQIFYQQTQPGYYPQPGNFLKYLNSFLRITKLISK